MRKVSWYLAGASIVLPAILLLQLPRGPVPVHGHLGDLVVFFLKIAAGAMCLVLSALAALLNGWAMRRSGPASDRRLAEWGLVASPVLLAVLAVVFYPVWRLF